MPVILRLTLYLLTAYALLVTGIYIFQRQLIYFPGASHRDDAMLADSGFSYWPDQQSFLGLISEPHNTAVKGTVIVFHGNGGPAIARRYYADALHPLGYRVILAEYPGYGGRPGKPSQASIVADAISTVTQAQAEYGGPIYLFGESLGSGVVAATLAEAELPVDGIVLITPWDSLLNLVQSRSTLLPTQWLLKDQYDSVKNLQSFNRRVAVAIAENDTVIPGPFSMNLFASIESEKKLWLFKNATHNSWPISAEADWWEQVMSYITE